MTVAVKVGLEDAPPLALAWQRFAIGGVCVALWGWWTGAPFRPKAREWKPLLGLGLLFTVQLALLNLGTWLSTAGRAAVLLNAHPVHIVLMAHFLVPGDRITPAKLGGVLLGYAGILVLFGERASGPATGSSTILLGDIALSVSAILLAYRQVLLNRQLQFIHPVKPLLAQVVIGTPLLFLLSLIFETTPVRPTLRLAGALFYQGVMVAGFNFIAIMALLKTYQPSSIAAFSLTTPLFGVLATALVLGEPIGWTLALSAVLVAGGIAAATGVARLGRRPRPAG